MEKRSSERLGLSLRFLWSKGLFVTGTSSY